MGTDLISIKARYQRELLGSVVPFWEAHGLDTVNGGYNTFLDRDGTIYDNEKWGWMQWRSVYTWATLAMSPHADEKRETWIDHARQGFDFLQQYGRDSDGNHHFVLSGDGAPVVGPVNIFTEAFAVMGSAALHAATGEGHFKEAALDAMSRYIARIPDPKGRWNKRLPTAPVRLALGPRMILANLGVVVKECLGVGTYDDAVSNAVDAVISTFWRPELGIVLENVNPDGSVDMGSCDGRLVNPGHGLETSWFMLQHAERTGCLDLVPTTCTIIKAMLDFGWDNEHGGIFYFMDAAGKPHVELSWDMKLWWVHLEALVATLKAYRLSGDGEFLAWFEKIDEWTWLHFPDPEFGEWFGYLNRRGEPTHALKAGRWKGFFHLPRALMLCIDELERLDT